MSEHLTRDDFAAQLNTKFEIYLTPETAFEAELAEVSELRTYPRQEVFSLIFLFPPDLPVQQRIYGMKHAALGDLELFLVPIEAIADGIRYEALFNRRTAN
ncbi:MAG TPA: hypothetical protein VGB00_09435 [Pyrinomonadaceae bacterium]|jgi:hypothetical protein